MKPYCVLTTINAPTKSVEKLYEIFGSNLIVVGDEKTPIDWGYKDAQYILDLPDKKGWYQGYAPRNSYARKNIGYLEAIKQGATLIFSCDDDNCPNDKWRFRNSEVQVNETCENEGWYNVYSVFSDELIWPRGISLKAVKNVEYYIGQEKFRTSSIQQGLADGEPDVDAIWRLVFNNKIYFKDNLSIYLNRNTWCPFNTQTTTFFKKAFPLMYLPVFATMRCCDIWSSFVAQRCLWEINDGVSFHSPSEVFQDRNEHDLLKDFEDEIDGYLKNDLIVETLSKLELKKGEENICENMLTCYQSIVDIGVLPEMEIRSLKTWIKDYEEIVNRNLGRP